MKTLNVRMDKPTIEELEMDGEVVHKDKKETKKPEEKTVQIEADYKSWIIFALVVITGCILIGAKLQDTGMQDNIRKIQELEKDNKIQDNTISKSKETISKAQDKIIKNLAEEDKCKKILKEKYHITYQ